MEVVNNKVYLGRGNGFRSTVEFSKMNKQFVMMKTDKRDMLTNYFHKLDFPLILIIIINNNDNNKTTKFIRSYKLNNTVLITKGEPNV